MKRDFITSLVFLLLLKLRCAWCEVAQRHFTGIHREQEQRFKELALLSSPWTGSSSRSSVMHSQSFSSSWELSHSESTRYAACSWSWTQRHIKYWQRQALKALGEHAAKTDFFLESPGDRSNLELHISSKSKTSKHNVDWWLMRWKLCLLNYGLKGVCIELRLTSLSKKKRTSIRMRFPLGLLLPLRLARASSACGSWRLNNLALTKSLRWKVKKRAVW